MGGGFLVEEVVLQAAGIPGHVGAGVAAGDICDASAGCIENCLPNRYGCWGGQAREIIAGALRRLPATADMLYLEYCFDECKAVRCKS